MYQERNILCSRSSKRDGRWYGLLPVQKPIDQAHLVCLGSGSGERWWKPEKRDWQA